MRLGCEEWVQWVVTYTPIYRKQQVHRKTKNRLIKVFFFILWLLDSTSCLKVILCLLSTPSINHTYNKNVVKQCGESAYFSVSTRSYTCGIWRFLGDISCGYSNVQSCTPNDTFEPCFAASNARLRNDPHLEFLLPRLCVTEPRGRLSKAPYTPNPPHPSTCI